MYSELETLFAKKKLIINRRKIQPMLQDILTDSNIMLKRKCKDWKDAIIQAAQPLLKNKIIKSSYIEAMINSVEKYGPYIVTGKHIALAHARPEDGVNDLGVSVMTLENPIDFGNAENDPVRLIFCLAAINDYSHLDIMRNVVELINDEEKVDELVRIDSVEEFKKILYRKKVEE